MESYLIALDIGGTKADAVLFRKDGSVFRHHIEPAGTPFDQSLQENLERTKATLDRLIAGVESQVEGMYASIATVEYFMRDYEPFIRQAFSFLPHIRIEGDGCCLISGMLGHRDGCSMICGTGSSLYIRQGDSYHHIGGGGHLIDSAGSGYRLGQLALQACRRAEHGSAQDTLLRQLISRQAGYAVWNDLGLLHEKGRAYIAAFARTVFDARAQGDMVARNIFNSCATDLANVIWGAYKQMGGPFDLVLNGGIVTHFPEYAAAIKALAPAQVRIHYSDVPPVYGCAVEAMYDLGLPCDGSFRSRFLADYHATE